MIPWEVTALAEAMWSAGIQGDAWTLSRRWAGLQQATRDKWIALAQSAYDILRAKGLDITEEPK